MTTNLTTELDHIKNVVETIEKKIDSNSKQMADIEVNIENKIDLLDSKLIALNKLINSNQEKTFNYLTEINTVTLFELKTDLKNQIIRSSDNLESGLAALISNVENVVNSNVSVYSETELKLLRQIKKLLEKK